MSATMSPKPSADQMTRFIEALQMFAQAMQADSAIGEFERVALAQAVGRGLSATDAVASLKVGLTIH